jgi:broad specificity phosphatase PhoE
MADQQQRAGITYVFRIEGEQNAKRFDDWVKRNNESMAKAGVAYEKVGDSAEKNMKRTSDAVEDSAKKTEKSSRAFIKSISGIYAAFVLLPNVAQQAGEAIQAAAADEDIVSSYERLAEKAEVSAERLLVAMKRASKGTVTEIELMREANRAFLAGGAEFARAIPQLFEIARATAAATGQEVIFVMDSLVKGIAKASIKLIDNAEVYIKVGKAVEDYAKVSGRTVDELDEVERRQAILNVVLEQGQGIIRELGGDVDFATDAFNRYDTQLIDAKRSTIDFFREALGDENLARFKQFADLMTTISPALQSLALLSLAGLPVVKIVAMAAALGVSVVALDEFLGLADELDQAVQGPFERAEDKIYGVRTGILSLGEVLEETKKSFLTVGQVAAIMFDDIINGTDDSIERIKALNEVTDKVSTTAHDASITNFAHAASLDALRAKQAEAAQAEEDRKNKVISIFEELSQAYAEARKLRH